MSDLRQHLFGQHIVQQIVPPAIAASLGRRYPSKPLVMSFHGWPGCGKNYVAAFIVKNFFKKGLGSSFFHFFSGRLHFPIAKDVALYQVWKYFRTMFNFQIFISVIKLLKLRRISWELGFPLMYHLVHIQFLSSMKLKRCLPVFWMVSNHF